MHGPILKQRKIDFASEFLENNEDIPHCISLHMLREFVFLFYLYHKYIYLQIIYFICVTQRFELFQRKALYKYVSLLFIVKQSLYFG